MAHRSIFDPDPANSASSSEQCREIEPISSAENLPEESDLAELAAKFTLHGGGRVSPEISADLALEIVLNEIAEQACLATPASGAAIVLERDGEWVCRASAGDNSPHLGARLSAEAGLSGVCIRTQQLQRCDDAQSDPRADVEACRRLGVRSVIILPLLQNDKVIGVFEAFSAQASAFRGRDERTLEVVSQRLLTILKKTAEPQATFLQPGEAPDPTAGPTRAEPAESSIVDDPIGSIEFAAASEDRSRVTDLWQTPNLGHTRNEVGNGGAVLFTWILGAAVLAAVLLLGVRAGQRFLGGKSRATAQPRHSVSTSRNVAERGATNPPGGASANPVATSSSHPPPAGLSDTPTAVNTVRPKAPSPPPGGLRIYENGKEIFRMPATAGEANENNRLASPRTGSAPNNEDRGGAGIVRAGIYELSPEIAEGSLLHRVEPEYPEKALQQQIQGPVVLDVHIGRDGSVQEVKLVSGQPLLADAAIAAVKQWKFQPREIQGNALEMQTRVTLNFRLPRS